jgi:hypothetical protein
MRLGKGMETDTVIWNPSGRPGCKRLQIFVPLHSAAKYEKNAASLNLPLSSFGAILMAIGYRTFYENPAIFREILDAGGAIK